MSKISIPSMDSETVISYDDPTTPIGDAKIRSTYWTSTASSENSLVALRVGELEEVVQLLTQLIIKQNEILLEIRDNTRDDKE